MTSPARRRLPSLLLHVLALALVSIPIFYRNQFALFWGGEGGQFRLLVEQQYTWMGTSLYLGLQPIMGAGQPFYPVNTTIIPVYMVQHLLFGTITPMVTYIW